MSREPVVNLLFGNANCHALPSRSMLHVAGRPGREECILDQSSAAICDLIPDMNDLTVRTTVRSTSSGVFVA